MQVQQYIYESPSTSSVQVGRRDPNSPSKNEEITAIANTDANVNLQAKPYKSTLSIVNVASSSNNAEVSASLNTFSTLNAQIQGTAAYLAG